MKKIGIIALLLILGTGVFAQSFTDGLPKGAIQLTAGLGLNSYGLPLFVQMDYSLMDNITLSPYAGLSLWSPDNQLRLAAYADYHFNRLLNLPKIWDMYAGLNMGFQINFGAQPGTSPLKAGVQLGGRYFWNKHWGINVQFGGGLDYGGRIGVSHRF